MKLSSYLLNTLIKDEEILAKAHLHKIVYFPSTFFMILGLILFIIAIEIAPINILFNVFYVAGAFVFIIGAIDVWRNKCCEMICTSKRVIIKRGIFSVKTWELRNDRIESISVIQSFWGRVLGYGNVLFSGTGTTRVLFSNIVNPVQTKVLMEDVISQMENDKK